MHLRVLAAVAASLTVAMMCGSGVHSGSAGTAHSRRSSVPTGAYLVAKESGRLLVLDRRGKLLRRVPRFAAPVQALALSPNRRSAYVSVYRGSPRPPRMYRVALATGRTVRITNASSPSLSPDHTQLAYVTVEAQSGIDYRTALAIRDLRTGRVRIVGLPPGVPMGTPPELVINWSPDGRSIALFDGSEVRTVDVRTARTVDSQPAIPGSTGLAPVYLDRQTLVVLANCCIGPQNLIAVDLLSGTRTPFARLASPVENVRRLKPGTLLVVTALHRLVRVTPGRTHSIAKRIVAATS